MTDPNHVTVSPSQGDGVAEAKNTIHDRYSELTHDQIARWSQLIASGEDAFPSGLGPDDHERLEWAVRVELRHRLLRLIADAVACRIHHGH